MEHYLSLFTKAIFTENMALAFFLGMCTFVACSKKVDTALGLGIAVIFVMAITTPMNQFIYANLLRKGALTWISPDLADTDLSFLGFLTFIGTIAAAVQLLEMLLDKYVPTLYVAFGVFLPLITVNCAILGASLFMVIREYSFTQTLGFGLGAGVGWALAIVFMAGLRQKMGYSNIPRPFQGVAITMIITGVMALAFMGFAGMVSIQ